MSTTKISCICPGEWTVSHGPYTVDISRYKHLDYEFGQWVVTARWLYTSSDPQFLLKDAKEIAKALILDAINNSEEPSCY